jgi:dolichyl-diphosphooligosaccharide--protein glycosyltransferase
LLNTNSNLISIGNFDIKLNHLIISLVLCLSFSISFLIRILPGAYGWELNEFDPFFNFRATQFIIENGVLDYFNWNDSLSWYPIGRDVSSNSQVILHLTTAISYMIFGAGDLYNFTIIFPVILSSFTTIVVFLLIRLIGGNSAGLIGSLLFSISFPIILRGSLGWFKSEPLGILLGLFGLYLFLSAIKTNQIKNSYSRILFSGIILSTSLSAWGGNYFTILVISFFIIGLSFIKPSNNKWLIPIFITSQILTSLIFERLNQQYLFSLGLLLIVSGILHHTIVLFNPKMNIKKLIIISILFFIIIIPSFVINQQYDLIQLPSFRYLNAINPFMTSSDLLVSSISEHATPDTRLSFLFHSSIIIFSGIGIWFLFNSIKNKSIKTEMIIFSLIFILIGIYAGSSFSRLEVFTSIALIFVGSLGFSFLLKNFLNTKNSKSSKNYFSIIGIIGISVLILIPSFLVPTSPIQLNSNSVPTILNGGTQWVFAYDDWKESLDWIKNNTDKNSVIGSWWDYGYWIQTLGERSTLADNSTVHSSKIKEIAQILFSSPDDAWKKMNSMNTNYFLIFISAEYLIEQNSSEIYYNLYGGGDESKKHFILQISEMQYEQFMYDDQMTPTPYFWNNTFLGKMIPFSPVVYYNPETALHYPEYVTGSVPIYKKEIKFTETDPFYLVYSSSSFGNNDFSKPLIGVLVYKLNPDYIPEK